MIETRPAWKRWINDQLGLKKLPDTREYVDTEPPADADELGGEAPEEEPESIPAPLPRLLPPDNSPPAGNPFQDDPPPESGAYPPAGPENHSGKAYRVLGWRSCH